MHALHDINLEILIIYDTIHYLIYCASTYVQCTLYTLTYIQPYIQPYIYIYIYIYILII